MNLLGKILAVALIGAMVTCVDHDPPTAARDRGIVPTAQVVTTVSHDSLTAGTNTANQKVYTTDPISPARNALVTVAVMGHQSTRGTPTIKLSGGGMAAWTEVATITFDAVAKPQKRLTIFRAMSATPGSGRLTITFNKSQAHCVWIVSQWVGVDTTGVNGAGAIAQVRSTSADGATGLTVTLAPFGNANNVTYGVFGVRQVNAVTPGTGFTEIAEQSAAEDPPSDLAAEWATNDNTIDASWATANGGALGVEIKAGTTEPVSPVASVDVSPPEATVPVQGTVQLTATARDAGGGELTGYTFSWASGAPAVATVSNGGLVTGQGPGDAGVTATTEGKSGTAIVHVTGGPGPSVVGQWAGPFLSPIVQVHLHLLPDGKVLSYGDGSNGPPQVWDPASDKFTAVPSPSLAFCAGHDFLPDGQLLVAGGGSDPQHGLTSSNIFDYRTASWQAKPRMAEGRWYPTTTTLPDGRALTLAGENNSGTASFPEVWDGAGWRQLTSASLVMPYYPRAFVAPDGRVFTAGTEQQSRWLDVTAGSWTNGPLRKFGDRPYGPAVMYEPGKILYAGGGKPATKTAEIIDLNQSNPQWTYTDSMRYARWHSNATVLPTGDVLVTGGTNDTNRANPAGAVNVAELWSPTAGTWTTLASSYPELRGYHSTSLLLPDGRVLHSGGGDGLGAPDNLNYELFSPPYLFKGARPVVTGMTGTVGYGQTVLVQTPDSASIAKVTLIRFGSVTHAFDMGQRLVPLGFSQASGGLSVTLPADRRIAPPGPYLLFLVNGNGVPSIGRILLLQ